MKDYPFPDAKWELIPDYMHDGVQRYVMHGHQVGSFLTLMLENAPIKDVACAADDQNRRRLGDWVTFIVNYVPSVCQGSPERVRAWQDGGGLIGQRERAEKEKANGYRPAD